MIHQEMMLKQKIVKKLCRVKETLVSMEKAIEEGLKGVKSRIRINGRRCCSNAKIYERKEALSGDFY